MQSLLSRADNIKPHASAKIPASAVGRIAPPLEPLFPRPRPQVIKTATLPTPSFTQYRPIAPDPSRPGVIPFIKTASPITVTSTAMPPAASANLPEPPKSF